MLEIGERDNRALQGFMLGISGKAGDSGAGAGVERAVAEAVLADFFSCQGTCRLQISNDF
jgi:hypothetical protein